MKKIKILYSGECTGASSGFGTYGHNIMSRLAENPNFHLAEFASFGTIDDGKYRNAKWKYYPNAVDPGHPEEKQYHTNPQNKFGAWRYDRVLLDFKPDIVITETAERFMPFSVPDDRFNLNEFVSERMRCLK
mgnify:CR=1 FL=1